MSTEQYNKVPVKRPTSSRFDLSHSVKLSAQMGNLIPFTAVETLPGDRFRVQAEALIRFAPMLAPVMSQINVYFHYWFVPNRILWSNWEDFITNQSPMPAPPFIKVAADNWANQSVMDYMGIPAPIGGEDELISALPLAAYQKIYNDWYRDENLIPEIDSDLVDGENTSNAALRAMRIRAWEHDYFTSNLPFAQKGQPVELPLSFPDVQVQSNNMATPNTTLQGTPSDSTVGTGTTSNPDISDDWLFAQTSAITSSTTINDLRTAIAVQEWLEAAARGGTRYTETLQMLWDVKPQDSRLQRPEYITGTKAPVSISEVLSTAETDTAPQGNMAGHAVSVASGNGGGYTCQEHGWIIGIMSVLPKTEYSQGIHRSFTRLDSPLDYPTPMLAHLGEQATLNKEIFAFQGNTGEETFGYLPRYAECKDLPSRIAGEFRTSLDFWHMARLFASPPALNEDFITANPTDRIFAVVTAQDKLYAHIHNNIQVTRKLPKFGIPSFF